jgi:hypothetical protein
VKYVESRVGVVFLGFSDKDKFSPTPENTDGEAAVPGPRLRRRGPRSVEARAKRLEWNQKRHGVRTLNVDLTSFRSNVKLSIFHINIRSLSGHLAELTARINLLPELPTLICINETWLDKSIENIALAGYNVVGRHDRQDGRQGGGVILFARDCYANNVTLIEKSGDAERLWATIHSDLGPYLLCVWYRPPIPGETRTIESFRDELYKHRPDVIGTIVIGDINIHHKRWLRRSSGNTAEGELLHKHCVCAGLQQLVYGPTRGEYLLDLVLSDLDGMKCKVLPTIADHNAVLAQITLPVPKCETHRREVWLYCKADWEGLRDRLEETQWEAMTEIDADNAANYLHTEIMESAAEFIPKKLFTDKKASHPWLNDRVLALVQAKHDAEGTAEAPTARDLCSAGLKEEYDKYVNREKEALKTIPKATKGWWSRTRRLLRQRERNSAIPALRDEKGEWTLDARDKADLLARTLRNKFVLKEPAINEYTDMVPASWRGMKEPAVVSEQMAERALNNLDVNSSTGPDLLPTRILKKCAKQLAKPVCILANLIIKLGRWPESWTEHWIVPLYKKGSVYLPTNYRGVHLTSQLSKVMERILQQLFMPYFTFTVSFGPNQFAYSKERGARDALAHLVMVWLKTLAKGKKIAVYCSDVSGAFDRVSAQRLLAKLAAKKVHPSIIRVMESWLRKRRAHVVVGGEKSVEVSLEDMVYQGTVWGPPLWNVFYEDARKAITEWLFTEAVYADDLNAYREFSSTTSNDMIMKCMDSCQSELHCWGNANQVAFDPKKESKHILSLRDPVGGNFKLLGVDFDGLLSMADAVNDLVVEAGWKLRMLIRGRRFYTDADMVTLYKAHMLSYIEYRTAAVYHATQQILDRLDQVQTRFLKDLNIDERTALLEFNLAPLTSRRDMAMLGIIHRTVLGRGPAHFKEHFRVAVGRKVLDPRSEYRGRFVTRSALGLVAIYNLLPGGITSASSVACFQGRLQAELKMRAEAGLPDWAHTYSPRIALDSHPLVIDCIAPLIWA